MSTFFPEKFCFDPLKRHSKRQRKGLRPASERMIAAYPSLHLQTKNKLCTSCRKEISELPAEWAALSDDTNDDSDSSLESEDTGSDWVDEEEARRGADGATAGPTPSDEGEMVLQLKEKFDSTTKRSEKVTILTVLPKSWSVQKVARVFGAPNYMARQAKKLAAEKGVLSSPDPKAGKPLPNSTTEQVQDFYRRDDVSKKMGKKDVVSVKTADGGKVYREKRLLLHTLKEVYAQFKEHSPGVKVGFSTFASLRPKECILTGVSGNHC